MKSIRHAHILPTILPTATPGPSTKPRTKRQAIGGGGGGGVPDTGYYVVFLSWFEYDVVFLSWLEMLKTCAPASEITNHRDIWLDVERKICRKEPRPLRNNVRNDKKKYCTMLLFYSKTNIFVYVSTKRVSKTFVTLDQNNTKPCTCFMGHILHYSKECNRELQRGRLYCSVQEKVESIVFLSCLTQIKFPNQLNSTKYMNGCALFQTSPEPMWIHWCLKALSQNTWLNHARRNPTTMMTSSNGNIFRVTGPLCREFTGHGEFPTQRPVTRSFDIFFDLRLNKRLSKQPWGWWFETPSWSLWRQCNDDTELFLFDNRNLSWLCGTASFRLVPFLVSCEVGPPCDPWRNGAKDRLLYSPSMMVIVLYRL